GRFESLEGKSRSRNVVIEFKDYETALACYRSPEYQKARALREPHSVADIIVIEGYDGPQPYRIALRGVLINRQDRTSAFGGQTLTLGSSQFDPSRTVAAGC